MLGSLSRSRTGMRIALGIGRALPRRAALPLVDLVAGRMASDAASALARAVRSNQYVVSGGTLVGAALHEAARENVRQMAGFLYDLYHVLGIAEAEDAIFIRDEAFEEFLERERTSGPYVYVGVHLGNFDLLGRVLGRSGWRMQVLSVPDPNGGYQWQNDMRDEVGFDVTPVSLESLRAAARRLEAGGSVLTGLDRPLPEPDKVRPRFFGHEAPLPLLHVRLAMRARVPVIAFTAPRMPDGRYRLLVSDPIPMEGDRVTPEALLANAERCLEPAERWIAEYPRQWAMPHAVWPDVRVPD
ncbi:MAG: lysophospholipid acyltransferase family protein [Coriobacteriia bacterium]|nr:lysophospholipid acyltransferase family protein [Coriobacteriia bacterium]